MTEVTSVRQRVRPRPLGLLKHNNQCYTLTSKVTSSEEGREDTRSYKIPNGNNETAMKGPLQQATLINIVAAVNEDSLSHRDTKVEPGSPKDALCNNIAVVSSIISPRERTISIPTTQVVFELPVETIQKKPVYYKHSEDEEVHRKESSANVFSKVVTERTKVNSPKPYISSEKAMKRLHVKAPCFDHHSYDSQRQKTDTDIAKPSVTTSWSPVRRLGAWKRSVSRAVHQLSKCEAVDIMDSDSIRRSQNEFGFSPDPTKITAEEKLKIIPPSPANPYPFYRAKSLPAVFPAKTTKSMQSPQSTESRKPERFRNRPISSGYISQSADVRKTFNLCGNVGSDHSNQSNTKCNHQHDHEYISPYKLDLEKSKDALRSQYSLSGSGINPAEVRGRAFGQESPKPGQSAFYYSYEVRLNDDDISLSKENIHPGIRFTTNGRPRSRCSTASSKSQSSTRASANSRKGCLTNKPGPGEFLAGRRTPKRVKFARRPSSTSTASNNTLDDEPIAKINAFGGSSILQIPKSNITAYSPGPQPLSAQELQRLKQKFIPANVHVELAHKPIYNFSNHAGMKIRSIQQNDSDDSRKAEIENDTYISASNIPDSDKLDNIKGDLDRPESNVSERELDFTVFKENNDDGSETLGGDRAESQDKFKRLVSDLDDESDDSGDTENISESDDRREISYQLVKAVDLDSYSEFEHKKIRKALNNSLNSIRNEKSNAHFVRVQMKEGE